MSIQQGFMLEGDVDIEVACAFAADNGFEHVEVNAEGRFHRTRVDPAAVRRPIERYSLDLVVHLPYALDPGSPHEHVRDGACRELEAGIDAAAEMGADRAVFHATTFARSYRWDRETVREAILDGVERVSAHGRERGVDAVAENLKTDFFDADDFPLLFSRTSANACLDTGHAHVTGQGMETQARLLREHGDRISHVHLNETRRDDEDEHLPVGIGRLDFETLARAMVDSDWSGTCTHEVLQFGSGGREYVAASKRAFDRLRE